MDNRNTIIGIIFVVILIWIFLITGFIINKYNNQRESILSINSAEIEKKSCVLEKNNVYMTPSYMLLML